MPGRELDAGKLLQQHRHDVRAARSRLLAHDDTLPDTDDHGADDTRQQQVVRQVEPPAQQQRRIETLDGRGVGIDQPRQHVHETGRIERRQHRARTELPAENQHRGKHQRHVEHIAERTDLNRREDVVEYDTHTVDASRHEIVGIDEQHETRAHDRTAEENQEPRAPPRPRTHRLQQSLCIHKGIFLGKDNAILRKTRRPRAGFFIPKLQIRFFYYICIIQTPEKSL